MKLLPFVFTYATWTARITVIILLILWFLRKPVSRRRAEVIHDVLIVFMICGWGAFLILLCDPWTSLTSYMESDRIWSQENPGMTRDPSMDPRDMMRQRYQAGLSLGHFGLQALVLPVFLHLRKRLRPPQVNHAESGSGG